MKTFIEKFKNVIRFIVSIFVSREFAFIYCLSGTIAQVAHTWFLTYNISSFDGWFRTFQAVLISFFISSSLLFFVSIADESEDTKESKRIRIAVNVFMIIEILINIYYYTRHLIIDSKTIQIFDYIFGVLVACLIPVTIKLYASTIKAKEWMKTMSDTVIPKETILDEIKTENSNLLKFTQEELDINKRLIKEEISILGDMFKKYNKEIKSENELFEETLSLRFDEISNEFIKIREEIVEENKKSIYKKHEEEIDLDSVNKLLDIKFKEIVNSIESKFNEMLKDDKIDYDDIKDKIISELKIDFINKIDKDVSNIFQKHQELFLQQFENKCKTFMNDLIPKH
jgi:hypothetical protein